MGENSKIEWTNHTCNLWWGCTSVHAGCDNCYAEAWSARFDGGTSLWGNDAPRRAINSVWKDFARYQRKAAAEGVIKKVFVGSMMDIFEKPKPVIDSIGNLINGITTGSLRDRFFNEVVPACPNLMFLLLTKRPSNINKYIPESWKGKPPSNVMFGTSPVNQETADKLIPQLLEVNGKKFLSIEPQLGHIKLYPVGIDWVICGGESGPGKREFNPDWARDIQYSCKHYGIPFFMKQWDKVIPIPDDLMIREFPEFFTKK